MLDTPLSLSKFCEHMRTNQAIAVLSPPVPEETEKEAVQSNFTPKKDVQMR